VTEYTAVSWELAVRLKETNRKMKINFIFIKLQKITYPEFPENRLVEFIPGRIRSGKYIEVI
jgi:hypothetical protein